MVDKDYTFTVIGEDGKDVLCDTLAVINRSEENKDPLIIYTDYSIDEDGKINLYVSELKKDGEDIILNKVDEETYNNIPNVREAMEQIWEEKK